MEQAQALKTANQKTVGDVDDNASDLIPAVHSKSPAAAAMPMPEEAQLPPLINIPSLAEVW